MQYVVPQKYYFYKKLYCKTNRANVTTAGARRHYFFKEIYTLQYIIISKSRRRTLIPVMCRNFFCPVRTYRK